MVSIEKSVKYFLFLSLFLFISNIVLSQINVSASAVGSYPLSEQQTMLSYGAGSHLSIGYQIKTFEIGIAYTGIWFSSVYDHYYLSAESMYITYRPLQDIGFIIGAGGMYSQNIKSLEVIPGDIKDIALGYKLYIGSLTSIFKSQKLFFKSTV